MEVTMSNLFKRNPIKRLTKAVPKSLYLLTLIFCISCMGMVSAVECNADLSQGGNSCTVSSSLTLNGSYIINMNGTNAIIINAHNIILDFNLKY